MRNRGEGIQEEPFVRNLEGGIVEEECRRNNGGAMEEA